MAAITLTLDSLDDEYGNNTPVTVSATASSSAGISQVEFFIDGVSVGTDSSGNPYMVTFSTSDYDCGRRKLTIVATDADSDTETTIAYFCIVLYVPDAGPTGVPTDWRLPEGTEHLNYTQNVEELNILPEDMNLLPEEIQINPDLVYEIETTGVGTEARFYAPRDEPFYVVATLTENLGFYFPMEPEVCEESC